MRKQITAIALLANVFVVTFLVQATVLAFASQFKPLYLYIAVAIALIFTSFFVKRVFRDARVLPNLTAAGIVVFTLVAALLIFFPHDTLGGSDEAVYSNYAIHLAQAGSLRFGSNLNNLPDKRIENVRLYPPGYIVWLAAQQSFFHFPGITHGNLILITLGLFSLFLVSYVFGNQLGAQSTIVLFSSSMPFLWFSRQTLSENLTFFLLWSLILFIFITLKTKRLIYLICVLSCSWLLAITRLEGYLMQFILIVILPLALWLGKVTNLKKILLLTIVYLLVMLSNFPIVKSTFGSQVGKAMSGVTYYVKRNATSVLLQKNSALNLIRRDYSLKNTKNVPTLYDRIPRFFAQMLIKYNFFLIIISILLVAGRYALTTKLHSLAKLLFLVIFVILLPEYYKLLSPGISIFEPWLYRRYMYALLPFGYISFYILLKGFTNKKVFIVIFTGLLVLNIALSSQILFVKNNWLLADKIEELTKDVSKNDFVMIKSGVLGDYYPISFLTINKNIRSAFTSQISEAEFMPKKKTLNKIPYQNIFLLSTDEKDKYPSFNIISRKSVDIAYDQLVPSCQLRLLVRDVGLADPYNIGVLPVTSAIRYCSKPGNKVEHHKETLYLYELAYEGI